MTKSVEEEERKKAIKNVICLDKINKKMGR